MSKTYKDEPYNVRARKAHETRVIHEYPCRAGSYHKVGGHVTETQKIFFAHEVKEMTQLEEELNENEALDFTVSEVLGFLKYYDREASWDVPFDKNKAERLDVVESTAAPVDFNVKFSKKNIFYVYNIKKISDSRVEYDDCSCHRALPKKMASKKGCPCCELVGVRECKRDRQRAQIEAVAEVKSFNSL